MEEIIVIEQQSGIKRDKTRVAAYCRVSTDQAGQEESFDTQVNYYKNLIESNPRWEFIGIYADKGYSGTNAKARPEFMRLIEDAYAKKVDIILTKSVSRFARNVVDCQTYTKELKEVGVEVRFEREQISNMDPNSDFLFSILAAVAQEESHSISRNVRWRYEQDFKKGIYRLGNNRILGFDMNEDGKLVPNDDAWIVKLIYEGYANGMSLLGIAKMLTDKGAKRLRSSKPFTSDIISRMLRNEYYVGDMLLQKTAPKDYLTKAPQKNAFNQYYIKNSHQGIVSREVWDAVQKRFRDIEEKRASMRFYYGEQQHFLYSFILCGLCGSPCVRRTFFDHQKKYYYKAWVCRGRYKGKKGNGCKNKIVREDVILKTVASTLGIESFCKEAFDEKVNKVVLSRGHIRVALKL